MEKKRLFVGSLPHEIDEEVIKNRFSKYGEVLSVELKHRYGGLNENDIVSTFAFVDLQASQEAISTCLKKLSKKKWLGKEVTIQFAKESVLSRLENERKSNIKNSSKEVIDNSNKTLNGFSSGAYELQAKSKDSITAEKTFKKNSMLIRNSSTEGNSSGILSKLENFSDVWKDCDEFNGRKSNKIEDADFSIVPSNILENDEEQVKNSHFSSESFKAYEKRGQKDFYSKQLAISSEEKRLKSVENMKKAIDQRKLLVKKALSSVDSVNQNKKIVFNDDDDDDDGNDEDHNSRKNPDLESGNKLFNDDSNDEDEVQSFSIKQQFEGEKGKKLFQLQSRFGNDSRFFMDKRFYESDEEKTGSDLADRKTNDCNSQEDDENETIDDEVQKQLQILQSIVGDKDLSRHRKKQKVEKRASAAGVRFDPSIPEHEKFIMKASDDNVDEKGKPKKSKNKRKGKEDSDDDDDKKEKSESENKSIVPEVSKETFYEVADELKETFKSAQKSSFSFSELFKSSSGDSGKTHGENMTKNSSSVSKKNALFSNLNDDRFGGDFSSELEKSKKFEVQEKSQSEKRSGSLWNEHFFYKLNDPRLEEAQKFFSRESFEEDEDFEGKRKELKKIIKKKFMNKARNERPFKKKIGNNSFKKNFKRRRLH